MIVKGVTAARLFHLLPGKKQEGKAKLFKQLILPLFHQAARGDDQHALGVGPHQELADIQPGHDGLACAGIIGENKAQGLTWQHCFVDGGNLVRQGLHVGGVHRHHRVEKVGQVDSVGLGDELEIAPRRIKGPGASDFCQGEPILIAAKEHSLAQGAVCSFVVDRDRIAPDGLGSDDAHDLARL